MRFRKLRIAWSGVWGLLAVLLCILWVRSYWRIDGIQMSTPFEMAANSEFGTIEFSIYKPGASRLGSYNWITGLADPTDPWARRRPTWHWWTAVGPMLWGAAFPIWSAVLLFIAVGAIAWVDRVWRFSLRTLLIATTLVAVVLGLAVWATRK